MAGPRGSCSKSWADWESKSTFVDASQPEAVEAAIRPRTRLVFVETPTNPTLELTDLEAIADVAHRAGTLLAVDNTFMTSVLQLPLEWGADISVYSTTKWIDGHSIAIGGAVISRDKSLLERLQFIRKSTGGILPPFPAWLTLQGLKTLPLRIRRQSETAAEVARSLQRRAAVRQVYYPGLEDFSQLALAEKQHRGYHGAVVSFELEGGIERVKNFTRRLRFCRLVEHIGGAETLITHPATMTHADVPAEQRAEVGITDGLVRASIGLEDAEAIIEDLVQAMDCAYGAPQCRVEEGEPCATVA